MAYLPFRPFVFGCPFAGGGAGGASLAFRAIAPNGAAEVQGVLTGTGDLADGRGSSIWPPDHEEVYQEFGTTEPAYEDGRVTGAVGSRVVYATDGVGDPLVPLPMVVHAPAATNVITYSNDLTGASWVKSKSTATYDQIGLTGAANTASKMIDDSAGGTGLVRISSNKAVIAGERNVFRVIAKADQLTWLRLEALSYDNTPRCYFDLGNGVIGTLTGTGDADMRLVATGVYECLIEWESTTDLSGSGAMFPANADGNATVDRDGTSSVIILHAEFHRNKTIAEIIGSPPIFTSGASVTRALCVMEFDDANHNDTNGAYYLEFKPSFATADAAGNIEILSLGGGVDLLYYDVTAGAFESTDGTNTAAKTQTLVAETTYKIAVAYGDGSLRVCVDGTWGTEQSYDGAFASGTELALFRAGSYVCAARDLRRYSGSYASLVTKINTLMA